ncbi:MAG: phosphate ABC transporter substrate-binding/OmpA family protein [Candidatus Nanoarchaeia archaeon]|nr:phosphate ABC transporter substrate-binding/OmpA family protein [Candidatus Nanoarchaeia archaeon]
MSTKVTPFGKLFLILLILGGVVLLFKSTKILNNIAPTGKQIQDISPDVFKGESQGKLNRPIRVGLNTWGGFAGGQYFNGSFKANQESKFYKEYGIMVEFIVIDDFAAGKDAWKADKIDVWYCTIDSFPVDVGGIQNLHPQVFLQTDWSRGGDAIVVRPGIESVSELKGKRVAVATGSPSHTFLLWMLSAGDLNYSDIKAVQSSSGIESASYFKAGKVDAAVVWSPDDQDCIVAIPNSKVLTSTKKATHIIADCLYAKKSFIEKYPNEIKSLAEGWLKGNVELNSSEQKRHDAAKILSVGYNVPEDFALTAINNARLCTYGDNINFFGLNTSYNGMNGQTLYEKMCIIFQKINLAENDLPPWRQIINTSIIQGINLNGNSQAAEGQIYFSKMDNTTGDSIQAMSTKKLTITFDSGSSVLDANAKYIIQMGVADLAKSFAGARIRIEGNTDNVGSLDMNIALSKERARSVANYLIKNYKFDYNRFIVIGNGPNKPVASNDTTEGRSLNRRTDFELLSE